MELIRLVSAWLYRYISHISSTMYSCVKPLFWCLKAIWLVFTTIFAQNDPPKVDTSIGLMFFKAREDREDFQRFKLFPIFFEIFFFCSMRGVQLLFIRQDQRGRFINSAFPNKKTFAPNETFFSTNENQSKCLRKFYVSSTLPRATDTPCQHIMRRTT